MAVLTWRDVASPNFSGVQDGFRNFGDLVNSAFSAARSGLNKFDAANTDAFNNRILAQVAGAQDTNAAEALLSSLGSLPGADKLTAATINAAMARPGDITKQAGAESDLNFTNYNRNRIQTGNTALDAAAPALAAAAADIQSNDPTKVAAGHEQVTKILSSLPGDKVLPLLGDLQGVESRGLGLTGTRTDQANSAQDRVLEQAGDRYAGMYRQSGLGPEDWNANFNSLLATATKEFGPQMGALVAERARAKVFGDPTAPVGGAGGGGLPGLGGGGSAGGDPSRVMNYEASGAGISSIPTSVQTLGQWSDFASGVNSKGIKSSAGGLYQITGDTLRQFAPAALGSNWQSAAFTPENQDKVGSAIFSNAIGQKDPVAALRGRWSSLSKLSDAQVSQIAHMPWEQARNYIAQGESGTSNVAAIIAQGAQDYVGQLGPALNKSQDPQQVFAQQAVAALGDGSDVRTVAGRLTAAGGNGQPGGPLAGEDLATVSGNVKYIADHYHVSPAYAGLILSKTAGFNKNNVQSAVDSLKGLFGGGDGLKSQIDWNQVDHLAKLAGNRDALIKQATTATVNDASSQLVAAASQQATAAAAAIRAKAIAAARSGRGYNPAADLAAAAQAGDLRQQALDNSAGVTVAGRPQTPQAPTIDRHNVPQPPVPASVPAPALRAQDFLLRQFQQMIPSGAGPLQVKGVERAFQQKYGVTIQQVRTNPSLAWQAAKQADNKAAALLASRVGNNSAYFAR